MNRLDRLILHGKDPASCVPRLVFERLRVAVLVAVVLVALGAGVLFQIEGDHAADARARIAAEAQQNCLERNRRDAQEIERQRAGMKVLLQLADIEDDFRKYPGGSVAARKARARFWRELARSAEARAAAPPPTRCDFQR